MVAAVAARAWVAGFGMVMTDMVCVAFRVSCLIPSKQIFCRDSTVAPISVDDVSWRTPAWLSVLA
jgi:hypothetical protein